MMCQNVFILFDKVEFMESIYIRDPTENTQSSTHFLLYLCKLTAFYLFFKGHQNSKTFCGKHLIRMWTTGGAQYSFYRWAALL